MVVKKMTKIISEDAFKEQLAKTQLGRKSLEMVLQALRNTPEYHKDTRKKIHRKGENK